MIPHEFSTNQWGYLETPRVTLWSEPEYDGSYHLVDLGDGKPRTFVHFDVFYWSASILKQIKRQWTAGRSCFPIPLYCMADDCTPKHAKFVKIMGFEPLAEVPCSDGRSRVLYVNYPSKAPTEVPSKESP